MTADQKALDYARARYETGVDDQISVVEAQNTLQNAQSTLINLGVARAQYEHAIAMLIGRNASDFSMPVKSLNATPPAIPIGIPSQLLERSPGRCSPGEVHGSSQCGNWNSCCSLLP